MGRERVEYGSGVYADRDVARFGAASNRLRALAAIPLG
jgi:hypothetical protein